MFQSHDHHIKDNVCLNRPPYRNGKKLRAVKVYTIAQESKYLLIQNIPSIAGIMEQLLPYFNQYGTMEQYWKIDGYIRKDTNENEQFFDTILIKFVQIYQARLAKCRLDDMNFMGSNLHICYAPEYENLEDLREKLTERRTIVQCKSNLVKRKNRSNLIRKNHSKSSSLQSFQQKTNEIRTKMREIVQKSNLIPLALQQEVKKKKRLQI